MVAHDLTVGVMLQQANGTLGAEEMATVPSDNHFAPHSIGVARKLAWQKFERNSAAQTEVLREIDATHSSRA